MPREKSELVMTWLAFWLLLGLCWGQSKPYETFDWRPVESPRKTSLHPYRNEETPTTTSYTSYDSRYFEADPYHGSTRYYPDNSRPYNSDSGPYSDDSYSSDYHKSQPYQYPSDDSGSYEQYGYAKDDDFNITMERYGGFGGTGDTRGFGAYDYPKTVQEVPQDLHEERQPRVETEYPDLLRVGRNRNVYHRRNPMHVHPLPPPL